MLQFLTAARNHRFDDAAALFYQTLRHPAADAPRLFTTLALAFAQDGRCDQVRSLLDAMRARDDLLQAMNVAYYKQLIRALCERRSETAAELAGELFDERATRLQPAPERVEYDALVRACARTGRTRAMMKVYHRMQAAGVTPQHHTFTALLDGFSRAGRFDLLLRMLDIMRRSRCRPNANTYTILFYACRHAKRVGQAEEWWSEMLGDATVQRDAKLYLAMVMLYFDANYPSRALKTLRLLQADTDVVVSRRVVRDVVSLYLNTQNDYVRKRAHYLLNEVKRQVWRGTAESAAALAADEVTTLRAADDAMAAETRQQAETGGFGVFAAAAPSVFSSPPSPPSDDTAAVVAVSNDLTLVDTWMAADKSNGAKPLDVLVTDGKVDERLAKLLDSFLYVVETTMESDPSSLKERRRFRAPRVPTRTPKKTPAQLAPANIAPVAPRKPRGPAQKAARNMPRVDPRKAGMR
jgi:pentatricopeptide repeat protein